MIKATLVMSMAAIVALFGGSIVAADAAGGSYPKLMTEETRADAEKLSALERPGEIFFQDGFESPDSLKKYFEVRGLREGRVKLTTNAELAHKGSGAIQLTAVERDGRESGAGATRLTEEHRQKLCIISNATKKPITQIVAEAVELMYELYRAEE